MGDEIRTPAQLAEEVAVLRLPPPTDQRLQALMDRNNDGVLDAKRAQRVGVSRRNERDHWFAASKSTALSGDGSRHDLEGNHGSGPSKGRPAL